ncbi:MAG: putative membrane protein [Natronomonas sp.]
MNRGSVAALVAFVVLVGAVAGTGVTTGSTAGSSSAPALQEDINPDDVLMEVAVEEDGDAAWRIEYRMELDTDEDEQAFEDLQSDIESEPGPYVERFHNRMNATADSAANATGREMAITNVTVSATREELPQERGVVAYTFRWSNFAATDGDRLVVGDAIDGLFLDENTSLLVSWPDEYALVDASPSPTDTRDNAVSYDGPTNFGAGEPRIELAPEGAAESSDGRPVSPLVAAIVVVLGLLAIGAVLVARRREGPLIGSGETGEETPPGGESPEAATEPDAADAGAQATTPPDPDLLSNEEQVLQLIEQRGGRMKQQAVAEELDWTDAKTSQVTKRLREEGDLEGFRLGRENVLALPDEDAAGDADGEQ